MKKNLDQDRQLIEQLGGPSALCDLLGYEKPAGIGRICNWRVRGIPAHVKVMHPNIFMKKRPQQKP